MNTENGAGNAIRENKFYLGMRNRNQGIFRLRGDTLMSFRNIVIFLYVGEFLVGKD